MSTPDFSNRHLVLFALYLKGGATHRVHTEDIAIKAHELFPQAFSWTRHPEMPDKDVVRVSLVEARRERDGALVKGRAGRGRGHGHTTRGGPGGEPDGWILTENGIAWIHNNKGALEREAADPSLREHRQKALRQLKSRVKDHALWERYKSQGEGFSPTLGELAELMRCRVDASPRIWANRFDRLRQQAFSTEQDDVLRFIDLCKAAYETQAV